MVRDILKEYDPEAVRFFLISGHYRSPINFSRELMEQAKNALARLNNAKNNMEHLLNNAKNIDMSPEEMAKTKDIEKYKNKFIEAMEDDLNTADAISAVFELVRDVNGYLTEKSSKTMIEKCYQLFIELVGVLGLLQKNTEDDKLDDEILKLVEERQEARKNKNFNRADEIRDELKSRGIILEDTPQGIKIHKKQ